MPLGNTYFKTVRSNNKSSVDICAVLVDWYMANEILHKIFSHTSFESRMKCIGWSKFLFNTTRSQASHLHVPSDPYNPNCHSVLRTTVFELHATLWQVHLLTLNWHWTLQGQDTPIRVTNVTVSQMAIHFALRQPFWSYRPFWKCIEWPKITLKTTSLT